MPVVAGPHPTLGLPVDQLVGDPEDLGIARKQVLVNRVLQFLCLAEQLAEATAEGDVLIRGEVLMAQNEDAVVVAEGLVDCRELFGADRLGDIQTDDFGAEGGAEAVDMHRHQEA